MDQPEDCNACAVQACSRESPELCLNNMLPNLFKPVTLINYNNTNFIYKHCTGRIKNFDLFSSLYVYEINECIF
jgi:hypothetical protein